ncbi:MAG: hypothetical protein V1779_00880 [bacterium]
MFTLPVNNHSVILSLSKDELVEGRAGKRKNKSKDYSTNIKTNSFAIRKRITAITLPSRKSTKTSRNYRL